MAIIQWLKGLEVTVKVNGQTATEYDPQEPERAPSNMKFHQSRQSRATNGVPYMVKYIEAKSGLTFGIYARRSMDFQYHGGHQIAMSVDVDGQKVPGCNQETTEASKVHQNNPMTISSTGVIEGSTHSGWKKAPFRFSNLNIVEDGIPATQVKEQILQAKDLGYLRVKLYRMGPNVPAQHDDKHYAADSALKSTSKMSEKALKGRALDCRVGLGKSVRDVGFCDNTSVFDDPQRRPFAVFDFRYRSLEGLYQEGIIPRPQPGPALADDADAAPAREVDAFALPETEARQMLQRFIDSREPHIKPENAGAGGRDGAIDVDNIPRVKAESSRGVKRERSSTMDAGASAIVRHPKERKLRNGRVEIDLTDD